MPAISEALKRWPLSQWPMSWCQNFNSAALQVSRECTDTGGLLVMHRDTVDSSCFRRGKGLGKQVLFSECLAVFTNGNGHSTSRLGFTSDLAELILASPGWRSGVEALEIHFHARTARVVNPRRGATARLAWYFEDHSAQLTLLQALLSSTPLCLSFSPSLSRSPVFIHFYPLFPALFFQFLILFSTSPSHFCLFLSSIFLSSLPQFLWSPR